MRATDAVWVVLATTVLVACSTPMPPQPVARGIEDKTTTLAPKPFSTPAELEEFLIAIYRSFGRDIKEKGHRLVFTEFGPDYLEDGAPDMFARIMRRASSGGVRFRGLKHSTDRSDSIRDQDTKEPGVVFMLLDIKAHREGGWYIQGEWHDKPRGELNFVDYHALRVAQAWKVQRVQPTQRMHRTRR